MIIVIEACYIPLMDILDCVRYMIAESGLSTRKVSLALGRSASFLSTTLSKGSDIGASNVAKLANLLGWHLVLKKGDTEIEVTPRNNTAKRPSYRNKNHT